MTLVFDTESTGLLRKELPFDDPAQPRTVQMAAKLYDKDRARVGGFVCLIRPDGWSIPDEAAAIHGITEARASRYGVSIVAALKMFRDLVSQAFEVVAHNMAFDRALVERELAAGGFEGIWWKRKADALFCTMEASKPILALPGKYSDYKFPSLAEAHAFLCPDIPFTVRHDAEADIDATARVRWALMDRPQVDG